MQVRGGLVQVETSGRGKKKEGASRVKRPFFLVPQLAQAGSVSASRGRTLGLRERERVGRSKWAVDGEICRVSFCRRGVKSGLVLVLVRWRDGKKRGRTDDGLGLKAANRAVAE